MKTYLLKIQHAEAVRRENAAEIKRTERELAALGIHAAWLSDSVMVWKEENAKVGRKRKSSSDDHYPDSDCSVCGKPIEKTGKPGRPPTKCLEHR